MLCLLRRPTHVALTPQAWSGCSPAIARFRRTPPSGSPNPRPTCFAPAPRPTAKGLDISGLTGVIAVDPDARTADVAGMCTYEDLVAATLPYGLAPLVVPQLKTITLGGAVTGLGIESASFRNGLPHESVLEMDILTGTGEVVTASPDLNADLFRAFPNSYGTLGYSVRLKIELETRQAVRRAAAPAVSLAAKTWSRRWTASSRPAAIDGTPVDYLDGVVFSADESYLTPGRADRRRPARSATTPASRSTTARSSTPTARSTTG